MNIYFYKGYLPNAQLMKIRMVPYAIPNVNLATMEWDQSVGLGNKLFINFENLLKKLLEHGFY